MPQINIPSFRTIFREDEISFVLEHVEKVLKSGQLTLGRYTEEWEKSFANLVKVKYALAVNSGTSALEMIFRSVQPVSKTILIPTNTNFATVIAAMNAGFEIRLYDSHLYTHFEDIQKQCKDQFGVLVVVHIGGYITPEISKIQNFCAEKNIILIEDAAHAHGAHIFEKYAGSWGIAGAFSFFPTKVITTAEGGMITTQAESIYLKAKQLRDQGKDQNGMHVDHGNSWRLSEIHAIMGLAQINTLLEDNARRRQIIQLYEENLNNNSMIQFPSIPETAQISGHKCIAFVQSRRIKQKLTEYLKSKGIQLGKGVYDIPIHQQPYFKKFNADSYPKSDCFGSTHICLPLWRTIKPEEIMEIIRHIHLFKTISNSKD